MRSAKTPATHSPVAAAEHREAAFGGEAVVNPMYAVFLTNRGAWIHDGFAAERSLAVLGSCYRDGVEPQHLDLLIYCREAA